MDEREMRTNRKKKCPSHWLHEEGREKGETERAKDGRKRSKGEEGIGALQFRAKHSHDGPIARRDTDAARSCKGSRPMSESGVNHHTLL